MIEQRIREDHCLAQARCETAAAAKIANRYGDVSFRQGHRTGFWDGVDWYRRMLEDWPDLTAHDAAHELSLGRESIFWPIFCEDSTFWTDCPGGHRTVIDKRGICDECGHDFA